MFGHDSLKKLRLNWGMHKREGEASLSKPEMPHNKKKIIICIAFRSALRAFSSITSCNSSSNPMRHKFYLQLTDGKTKAETNDIFCPKPRR